MTVSAPLPVLADTIPLVLTEDKRFTAWRSEERKGQPKPAKMPYSPIMDDPRAGASSTDPSHWTTFDKALDYAQVAGLDGVMRAFDHADGLVGVDLDNCRDPETGELTPEAAERVKRADTYTEVSPSKTGVKMWMYGTMPAFGHKRGDVEMYGSVAGAAGPCGRFFTQTGHHVEGTPRTVGYRPDFILALHREVFGDAPDVTTAGDGDLDRPIPALELGDEDVLRLASESPHNGEKFRRLWSGDTSDYAVDGNDGRSEALAALVELLVYYGGPDPERVDRLVRRSGLYHEKWERPDIRKRAFDLAMRGRTRFHGDSIQAPPVDAAGSDGASGCSCESCPSRSRVTLLERSLLDRDDRIESLFTANATLSIRLTERRADVERLNRQIYADYRLSKCKALTSSQRDTIKAIARVATKRADHFDNDAPIITGQTLGEEIGKCATTARTAADLVCSLPGSPIKRISQYRDDGKYGQLTTYELVVRDPVEILEKFVVIAENLEEKKSSRPQPPKCSEHPNAPVVTYSRQVCGRCRKTLASTFPGEDALCAKNVRIEGPDPTVDEPVVTLEQNVRIAAEPLPFPTDPATRPKPWRCPCGSLERYPRPGGGYRCDGCGDVTLPAVSGAEE